MMEVYCCHARQPCCLGLIQPRSRLDYLPPRASLITSSADHPKKMKEVLHTQKKPVAIQKRQQDVTAQAPAVEEKGPKLITSKEMIMHEYPDVFQGLASFQDQIIISSLTQAYLPSRHPVD